MLVVNIVTSHKHIQLFSF